MRPMRARAKATKTGRASGRVKAGPRAAEKRFEPRAAVFGKRKTLRMDGVSRLFRGLMHSFPARRPMLSLTLFLILGGGLAGLFSGGYLAFLPGMIGNPFQGMFGGTGFRVAAIGLSGNDRTSSDDVYAALGFGRGDPTFGVNPARVRERLMTLPWVAEAEVRRRFPDAISVTLIEKRPFALWRDGTAVKVVERSGAVITTTDGHEFTRLPLLVGAGAPEEAATLMDAVEKHRAVAARLRWADRVSGRRWDLMLDGKVQVKLPEEGWQAQLGELEKLIVDKAVLERDIEMIDLRFPDSYIFRLRNGDSQPVTREKAT